MKTFAERLKYARTRAQLSQDSLAQKSGVTKAALSQWENSQSAGCKIDTLFNLADSLMVDARWLATGRGEPETTTELPHHLQAGKSLDKLPLEAKEPLVKLINALALASDERFWKWAKEVG